MSLKEEVQFPVWVGIILFTITTTQALGTIQPLIQPENSFSCCVMWLKGEADNSPQLNVKLSSH
jgi:hypothetical protein